MLQGFDIVVGQQGGELVAPVEGQDGVERVLLFRTPVDRLAVRFRPSMIVDH
ncbi:MULTISPECIES: hypothetical protein [Sinorhizobium]|uniref:hypothetical protein n=1 Tax=Sinorhizobium TaxID=28105 RepID=UPI00299DE993